MNSCHPPVERAADTRRKPARNPERMILAEHTADCNPVVAAADTRNNPVERAVARGLLVFAVQQVPVSYVDAPDGVSVPVQVSVPVRIQILLPHPLPH